MNEEKTTLKGVGYGLIPHIGCILFVIASILGATVLMQFLRPILLNKNIFYYLIAISLGFATLSSFFYLRKNKKLSWYGIREKKGYLLIMYGSTVGVNLLLFFLIFPLLANIGVTGMVSALDMNRTSILEIQSQIPCPGHAPLVSGYVKELNGVNVVEYSFPDNFKIYYNPSLVSKEEILNLEIFNEFPTKVISEE